MKTARPTAGAGAVPFALLLAALGAAQEPPPSTPPQARGEESPQAERPQRPQAPRDEVVVFTTPDEVTKGLAWRELGPANFSGRIVDLAVDPRDANAWYVAAASGGVWKTVNRGLDFKPIFDDAAAQTIGAIALDPQNPEIVWVGTGEANNQRSSYWGDGVWKSEDGGKTWKNVGLPDSHHIGRIAVDPTDGKRVFVAVLGHLYTPNEERGLYRTTDGGQTWQRVLKVSPEVGVVDVAIQPGNPKVLLAATYERLRRAWHFDGSGPGSGIWRSDDGGTSWKRLEGGLPKGDIGRIGVAFAPSKPDVVYATVENENMAAAVRREPTEPEAGRAPEVAVEADGDDEPAQEPRTPPQQQRGPRLVGGEIYRSEDAGKTWKKTNRTSVGGSPGYYYGQIRVDPSDAEKVFVLSVPLWVSKDGGKSWSGDGARGVHVDHHALWIDPSLGEHWLLGNDGGLHETWDGGKSWIHFENLPIAQFYAIGVDHRQPYYVYGGTQDNGTWGMPSAGPTRRGIRLEDVFRIGGGDGFYAAVDAEDPNVVYCESQFGALTRIDVRSMRSRGIRPRPGRGEGPARFNWSSPLVVSPHNHTTIYFGGNKLYKSLNRGDAWTAISDDLTTNDATKLKGNVPHCTITALAESPLRQGLLWAGTDDGRLWVTPDDGRTWRNLDEALPKKARGLWISRVEPSRFKEGRCYVSVTGYREDMFEPLVYTTDDYGMTFRSIAGDLPAGEPVNVVREDPRQENLLFAGTEFGVYVSRNRGGQWQRLGKGMPRAAVHDLVVHPREPDLVAGTHGRGIWVLDVAALEEWHDERNEAFLAKPRAVQRFPRGPDGGYTGATRIFTARNPKDGVELIALVPPGAREVTLSVRDAADKVLKSFDLAADQPGLHVANWNLTAQASPAGGRREGLPGMAGNLAGNVVDAMAQGFRQGMGRGGARPLRAGAYRVQLSVDGRVQTQVLNVLR